MTARYTGRATGGTGHGGHRPSRALRGLLATMVAVLAVLVVGSLPAGATSYVPISGEGSSWSANALNQWIADVQQYGMRVNYTANGSTQGREDWISGLSDFAASDIPFQTNPSDGSAPESPQSGSYAYMPITAGGTVFMYNLKIDGQQVTNLRLSGENIAKIYTGVITNWDNPALAADNPGLTLPNEAIVPVVRSDGAGDSFELTEWMQDQYPSLWSSYCAKSGRAPACGPTSFYPTVTGMIAQSGDLGVAGYVSANYASGSIGYVNYSYALNDHFPVAQMLNSAGYYTEPTPQNVAVSLLSAQVNTSNPNDEATYLTENLTGVYTDPDPRTYPLSSYSYLILPIKITPTSSFSTAKGATLAAFSYYAMCQGQQQSAPLGYSPMPINLVQDSFLQIKRIPGAVVQNINIQSCDNPTFSTTGVNTLAATAPYPPACDKQGPTQCTTGTGGATAVSTPPTPGSPVAAAGGAIVAASTGSSGGTTGLGATGGSSVVNGAGGAAGTTCASSSKACAAASAAAAATRAAQAKPSALPDTLAVSTGWSWDQYLMILVALLALAVILIPGWFAAVVAALVFLPRRISRHGGAGSVPTSAGPPPPTGGPAPPTGPPPPTGGST
jgi:phosphate ABC transporter phosphate-binding protein